MSIASAQIQSDSLDNRRYFPLEVGNEWQYVEYGFASAIPTYLRTTIVSDTLANGLYYFQFISERFSPSFYVESEGTLWVRYNDVGAAVFFESIEDDTLAVDSTLYWYHSVIGDSVDLGFGDVKAWVTGSEDTTFIFLGKERVVDVAKILYLPDPLTWQSFYKNLVVVSDFGQVWFSYFDGGSGHLAYAKIGGVEYGEKAILVSRDEEPAFLSNLQILGIYPNPANRYLNVDAVSSHSGPGRIDVFDTLGRKVFQKTIVYSTGITQISLLDITPLTSGNYFLRLMDEAGRRVRAQFVISK